MSQARVLYTFSSEWDNELTVAEGEIIDIVEEMDDGWSMCTSSSSGRSGLVPSSYYEKFIMSPRSGPSGGTGAGLTSVTSSNDLSSAADESSEASDDGSIGSTSNSSSSLASSKDSANNASSSGSKFKFPLLGGRGKKSEKSDATAASGAAAPAAAEPSQPQSKPTRKESIRVGIPKPSVGSPKPQIGAPKPAVSGPKAASSDVVSDSTDADEGSESTDVLSSSSAATSPTTSVLPGKLSREPRAAPKVSEKDAKKLLYAQILAHVRRKRMKQYLKKDDFRSMRMRNELVRETYTTEKTYVHMLDAFVAVYVTPLKSKIDAKLHKTLFNNVEQILQINQQMLAEMDKIMVNYPIGVSFGKIFKSYAPFLKTYTVYINAYDESFQTYEQSEKKNPKLKEMLDECKRNPRSERHEFDSFLILPVQRIPRYKLLLSDILKNTPEGHRELADLKEGLESISSIATYVNESKRTKEQSQFVIDLGRQLRHHYASLVQPNRYFIKQGQMRVRCLNKSIPEDSYVVYLLSDMIILVDASEQSRIEKKKKLKKVYFIMFTVSDLPERGQFVEFALETIVRGQHDRISFVTASQDERNEWEVAIDEQIQVGKKARKNKGMDYDTLTTSKDRIAYILLADGISKDHERLEKELVVTEKKLQKTEMDLRMYESELKKLINKIVQLRSDKAIFEKAMDDQQTARNLKRETWAQSLAEVRERDSRLLDALAEDEAFPVIFNDKPGTPEAHNAMLPKEKPLRQYYFAQAYANPNLLIVDDLLIQLNGSAFLPASSDNTTTAAGFERKSLPQAPGAPGSGSSGANSPALPSSPVPSSGTAKPPLKEAPQAPSRPISTVISSSASVGPLSPSTAAPQPPLKKSTATAPPPPPPKSAATLEKKVAPPKPAAPPVSVTSAPATPPPAPPAPPVKAAPPAAPKPPPVKATPAPASPAPAPPAPPAPPAAKPVATTAAKPVVTASPSPVAKPPPVTAPKPTAPAAPTSAPAPATAAPAVPSAASKPTVTSVSSPSSASSSTSSVRSSSVATRAAAFSSASNNSTQKDKDSSQDSKPSTTAAFGAKVTYRGSVASSSSASSATTASASSSSAAKPSPSAAASSAASTTASATASSTASSSTAKSQDFTIADLEKLAALKEKGIITQAEFEKKKKEILGI